ncbi:hypothetical protein KIW84_031947 [Lathyrus oleraceus]|uniref:Uncharacterized protein n=1 Tax=Pisum sativum TaxID=3888 RepID=A0A9D5B120_PEA|nr:hypothetical protein KIW84_031947 [Pisum sativum]
MEILFNDTLASSHGKWALSQVNDLEKGIEIISEDCDEPDVEELARKRKIESRRVLAAVERGRTVPNWRPHLLGGGLGTTRVGGEEVIQRHSGRRTDYDHVESKHEKELHVERELDYEPDDHHGRYNQPGHGHRHADPEHDPDQYDHYEHQRGRGKYDEEDAHGDYNQPPDPDMIEDNHPTGEKSKSRDRDRNCDMDRDYHRSERSHPREYDY